MRLPTKGHTSGVNSKGVPDADWQLSVDIGGTFTDILLVDRTSGAYAIEKRLTTHSNPADAVRAGLEAVLERNSVAAAAVRGVVHATTLVTNAIIERQGSRTSLLVTEGFGDLLTIGREHRYDMYDVRLEKPDPLVARWDIFEIPERVLADGSVHQPMDGPAVEAIAQELRRRDVEAVAVCLIHAYRHPEHERAVRTILTDRWPEGKVTLSHEVVGQLREYERASTTVANAYVLSLVEGYLAQLQHALANMGYRGKLLVMLSSGSTATTDTARMHPVRLIESGPAAGALAAAEAGQRMGLTELLSFDMGGTTAKACVISGGRPSIANEMEVARLQRFRKGSGIPLQVSSVELIEIGAGGGSHARVDRFDLVQVGPDSAGSDPGPICYGAGGRIPTVTDADLVLGYLNPQFFLGGQMKLDLNAARAGIQATLADPLALDVGAASWIVHEVVNENMANAARVHAVELGAELEGMPLFAFGGAGPVHAYRVALNVGMKRVIAPLAAGIGSTIGLLAAPLAFDYVRTAVMPVGDIDWPSIERLTVEMRDEGVHLLRQAGLRKKDLRVEVSADMRLTGQAHEITVRLDYDRVIRHDAAHLRAAFDRTYVDLFGRQPPEVDAEAVSWRIKVSGPRPDFPIRPSGSVDQQRGSARGLKGHRNAYFPPGGFRSTPVYDRYLLSPGVRISGPAIVEERESTFVIGPNGVGEVDEYQNLLVDVR